MPVLLSILQVRLFLFLWSSSLLVISVFCGFRRFPSSVAYPGQALDSVPVLANLELLTGAVVSARSLGAYVTDGASERHFQQTIVVVVSEYCIGGGVVVVVSEYCSSRSSVRLRSLGAYVTDVLVVSEYCSSEWERKSTILLSLCAPAGPFLCSPCAGG